MSDKKEKTNFYRLDRIDKEHAQYNVIYGERSNGKTFAVLERIVSNYCAGKGTGAYIRRTDEDAKQGRASQVFEGIANAGIIEKYTHGEWNTTYYFSRKWFFARIDDTGKMIHSEFPFCYYFALATSEHDKSTSYSTVTTICFDEFLSRRQYLVDEFVLFMNTLSTIIRYRKNVTIYMLGNTVNKYCPYFSEMGLKHVRDQRQGTIDVYTYGNSELKVAVEYAKPAVQSKPSDLYFAFDNPKLRMITSGAWEIGIYPHCPIKYRPKDVKFTYFIKFEEDLLQCEVVMQGQYNFTFIHLKTTPLKDPNHELIYDTEYNALFNYGRRITSAANKVQQKIQWYYKNDKVFYQDNTVGEIVRNYLGWSKNATILS